MTLEDLIKENETRIKELNGFMNEMNNKPLMEFNTPIYDEWETERNTRNDILSKLKLIQS